MAGQYLARLADIDELTDAQLPVALNIGAADNTCTHCLARLFKGELNASGADRFGRCCKHGKINGSIQNGEGEFPVPPPPPPFLTRLLSDFSTAESKKRARFYLNYALQFNNAFSFAHFTCHSTTLPGPYSDFRLQGASYTSVGPIRGAAADSATFSQVFFTTADEASGMETAQQRAHLPAAERLTPLILADLKQMLHGITDGRHGGGVPGCNPLYRAFKAADEILNKRDDVPPNLCLIFCSSKHVRPAGEHERRYNLPEADSEHSSTEMAAVIDAPESAQGGYQCDLVVHRRAPGGGGNNPLGLQRIRGSHRLSMALAYPLLFPHGDASWSPNLYKHARSSGQRARCSVTARDALAYRMYHRDPPGDPIVYDAHLLHGRLTQKYLVHEYTRVERGRLDFLRHNQGQLKADLYKEVQQAAELRQQGVANIGRHIVLPSTFTGGPRSMKMKFQDAMALVRVFGKATLFVTVTTNPQWPEILAELPPGRKAHHCPWIVARVFHCKLEKLKEALFKKHILGRVEAYTYVIEFQKRGLPHAHMLLIMKPDDRPKCADDYDKIICAEITTGTSPKHASLRAKQLRHMIHTHRPKCYAEDDPDHDTCRNRYPRPTRSDTADHEDSFPKYRRRSVAEGGHPKNPYVVPHNTHLLEWLDCHCNVEICTSITSVKYLFKYVYKGHDRIMYQLASANGDQQQQAGNGGGEWRPYDEIQRYLDARYVTTSEATWRTLGFPMNQLFPRVMRLQLHKPDEQMVIFDGGMSAVEVADLLAGAERTQLTEFFALCERETDSMHPHDPPATDLIYSRVPEFYTWERTTKTWQRRVRRGTQVVGRLRIVTPNTAATRDLFYLRMLLTIVTGPTSFANLRTFGGVEHATNQLACFARGLVDDDTEWDNAMEEAALLKSAVALRQLFVVILTSCGPKDAGVLWEKYAEPMAEDFAWKRYHHAPADFDGGFAPVNEADKNRALLDIEDRLSGFPVRHCIDYGMPAPVEPDDDDDDDAPREPREVREALDFDAAEAAEAAQAAVAAMAGNGEQIAAFNAVDAAVRAGEGGCFFLNAPGGTGKTFVAKALYNAAHARGQIVLPMASSGIAAILLPNGKTAHSTFRIPVKGLDKDSTCAVTQQSGRGKLIRRAAIGIWDEAPMMHRHALEAIDRTLRSLRNNDTLFGGMVFLLMGDWRQVLPIVPRASRAQIVRATLQKSTLWSVVRTLELKKNMRVELARRRGASAEDVEAYAKLLLNIGDGAERVYRDLGDDVVRIPTAMLVPDGNEGEPAGISELIDYTFGDMPPPLPERPPLRQPHESAQQRQDRENKEEAWTSALTTNSRYFQSKAILTPKNKDVDETNDRVLERLPGDVTTFLSADSIAPGDDNATRYPVEFLNSLNISGLPPHQLSVKIGAVLMLLRNLSPRDGLCNGTRFLLTCMHRRVLEGIVISGTYLGSKVMIPRIPLIPTDTRFPFQLKRLQFPVKVAFAMTINKSQGQSLERVGLFLPRPVFGHGQLYVALSRSGNPPTGQRGVRIVAPDTPDGKQGRFDELEGVYTRNVVYREVLGELG